MGCCTSATTKRRKDNLKPFREDSQTGEPKEYLTANDIFRGKKAKDVVDDTTWEDLIMAVKNGQFQLVEAICVKHNFTSASEIRGTNGEIELLKREHYNLQNWNILLIAIAYNNLDAFKFFTQQL